MATTTTALTTAQVADELGTSPRELRKHLRDAGKGVGKGTRYALPGTKREMNALRKAFASWAEGEAAKVAARKAKAEVEAEVVEDDDTDD